MHLGRDLTAALLVVLSYNVSALGWTPPQNVSNQPPGSRAFGPRIARDPLGNTHLVWAGGVDPSTSWQVWYQVFDGASWSPPLALSSSGGTRPDIAVDAQGTVHVCYEWPAEDNIWYRSKTAGGSWTSPVNLRTGGRSIAPSVAVSPAGDRILVAWHEDNQVGAEWDIFVNVWTGASWSGIFNVSTNSSLSAYPHVCIDTGGNMHVAWSDSDLRHRRRDLNGIWGPINTLYDIASGQRASVGSLHAAADGFVHAAYSLDDGSGDWRVWHKYYSGTWSSGVPVYPHAGEVDDIDPVIQSDEFNRLYMVWHDYNNIYYSSAGNFQGTWAPFTKLAAGQYLSTAPVITIDAGMTARAAWQARPGSGDNWNIYVSTQSVGTPGPQGTLAGEVRDQFHSPVAGAVVSTGNAAGLTDAGGQYSFAVPVGTYTATCTRQYFSGASQNDVTITAHAATQVNFMIERQPPAAVTGLAMTPGNESNRLQWTNPVSGQFTGTLIVYKTTGLPAHPADGTALIDKGNTPGSSDSHTHAGILNGQTYYYAAFAHDGGSPALYSNGANASGTPFFFLDYDHDGDIDQSEFAHIQLCLSGPNVPQNEPGCENARLDADQDVDGDDLNLFLGCFSGPEIYAYPGCLP